MNRSDRGTRPTELPDGVSNGLSGEIKMKVFDEVVKEDDELSHDGGEGDFLELTGRAGGGGQPVACCNLARRQRDERRVPVRRGFETVALQR